MNNGTISIQFNIDQRGVALSTVEQTESVNGITKDSLVAVIFYDWSYNNLKVYGAAPILAAVRGDLDPETINEEPIPLSDLPMVVTGHVYDAYVLGYNHPGKVLYVCAEDIEAV